MMNWIWLGLVVVSILIGGFTGEMPAITIRSFESAKEAVELALKLIGIMAFWLGVMRVAQESGLMLTIARVLRRPMRWLFPDIPEDHPAMSAMIMNFGANMLGLANAATPFGIKAMIELNKLNRHRGTASNAMCTFLAINTSSLSLLPLGTIGLRAAAGSTDPACIWLPSLLASAAATVVAIVTVKSLQRMARFQLPDIDLPTDDPGGVAVQGGNALDDGGLAPDEPQVAGPEEGGGWGVRVFVLVSVAAFAVAVVFHYWRWHGQSVLLASLAGAGQSTLGPLWDWVGPGLAVPVLDFWAVVKDFFSFWAVPTLMGGLLLYGVWRGVRVYESLVEGAKEGFRVAVRIIPYLVAILVAVAMFKASGAMALLKQTLGVVTGWMGMPAEALPMAIIRPLSGNGAFGYMSSVFTEYGPDSFLGKMVSVMQGSTETTLYVLAVYFGSVQVFRVRHALAAGLSADLAGIVAAVGLCHLFF